MLVALAIALHIRITRYPTSRYLRCKLRCTTGKPYQICASGGGDLRVSFAVSLSVPHFAVIRYFISRYVCRLLCRFVCRALAATADAYHFPDAGKMLTACHTAPNQALAD